jgi:transposase
MKLWILSDEQASMMKEVLKIYQKKDTNVKWAFDLSDVVYKQSWEYLNVALLNSIWDKLWFTSDFPIKWSKQVQTGDIAKILTINRCIDPWSKSYTAEWYNQSILPKILNISWKKVYDEKIYRELDEIEGSVERLQKHMHNIIKKEKWWKISIMMCDITSSFFYWAKCDIAVKSKNSKDNRPDEKQIVLMLLIDESGLPFYWDVYKGNTADVTTIKKTVKDVKELFWLEDVLLIFDRWFRSESNMEEITASNLKYLTSLDRNQIAWTAKEELDRFDELIYGHSTSDNNIDDKIEEWIKNDGFVEFEDGSLVKEIWTNDKQRSRRSFLGFDKRRFMEERSWILEIIEDTKKYIKEENIKLQTAKTHVNKEVLERKIRWKIHRRSLTKVFCFWLKEISITRKTGNKHVSYQVDYTINEYELLQKNRLDGLCVFIMNDFDKDKDTNEFKLKEMEVVQYYRDKNLIEQSFRYIKSFLKLRPFYVRKELRVKWHVTICILSHFINRYIVNKLKSKWIEDYMSPPTLYSMLGKNTVGEVSIKSINASKLQLWTVTKEQDKVLKALDCKYLTNKKILESYGIK